MQSATSDQPKITRKADHSGYLTPTGGDATSDDDFVGDLLRVQGGPGGVEAPHSR